MLNRISFRQMEYFVSTAQHGSIILASEKIHVSSPSISAAIAHIEAQLQVKLFIRQHAKGLVLTSIGEKILKECLFILGQTYSLYTLAAQYRSTAEQALHIGCHHVLTPLIYTDLVKEFALLEHDIHICVVDDSHHALMNQLLSNQIDMAITTDLNHPHHLIHFEKMIALKPHVLVWEHHPLAKLSSLSLEELMQYSMILYDNAAYQDYCKGLFEAHQLVPKIQYSCKNYDLVRKMLVSGLGYSITNLRREHEHTLDGQQLICLEIKGSHQPIHLGLATMSNANLDHMAQKFKQHCRSFIWRYYAHFNTENHDFLSASLQEKSLVLS